MNRKRIFVIISFIVLVIFMIYAMQQLQSNTALTKEQMTIQIEKVYQGTVGSLIKKNDYYVADFEKNGSTYEVQINPYNGEFSKLQAIYIAEITVKPDDTAVENTAQQPLLTEAQAIDIALKEMKGHVDSVKFKETTDGGNYFIEIEQDHDDEVKIQIHAITGKILSIQYDD